MGGGLEQRGLDWDLRSGWDKVQTSVQATACRGRGDGLAGRIVRSLGIQPHRGDRFDGRVPAGSWSTAASWGPWLSRSGGSDAWGEGLGIRPHWGDRFNGRVSASSWGNALSWGHWLSHSGGSGAWGERHCLAYQAAASNRGGTARRGPWFGCTGSRKDSACLRMGGARNGRGCYKRRVTASGGCRVAGGRGWLSHASGVSRGRAILYPLSLDHGAGQSFGSLVCNHTA